MSLRRIRRTLREDDGDEEEVALSPEVVVSRSKSKRRLITSDEEDDVDLDGNHNEEEDGGWEEEGEEEGKKERGHPARSPGSNTPAVDAAGGKMDKDEFGGGDQEKCGLLTPDGACGDVPKDASVAASTPAAPTGAVSSSAAVSSTTAAAAAAVEANVSPLAVKAVLASAVAIRAKGGNGGGRSKKRLRLGGLDELEGPGGLESAHAEVEGGGAGAAAALVDLTFEGNPAAAAAAADTTAAATTTAATAAAATSGEHDDASSAEEQFDDNNNNNNDSDDDFAINPRTPPPTGRLKGKGKAKPTATSIQNRNKYRNAKVVETPSSHKTRGSVPGRSSGRRSLRSQAATVGLGADGTSSSDDGPAGPRARAVATPRRRTRSTPAAGRPKRAAASVRVDYARMNEGEREEENESEDGDGGSSSVGGDAGGGGGGKGKGGGGGSDDEEYVDGEDEEEEEEEEEGDGAPEEAALGGGGRGRGGTPRRGGRTLRRESLSSRRRIAGGDDDDDDDDDDDGDDGDDGDGKREGGGGRLRSSGRLATKTKLFVASEDDESDEAIFDAEDDGDGGRDGGGGGGGGGSRPLRSGRARKTRSSVKGRSRTGTRGGGRRGGARARGGAGDESSEGQGWGGEMEDDDEEEEEDEEEEVDEQENHSALLHQQMLEEDEPDLEDLVERSMMMSPAHTEDASVSFMWYVEFLAKAAEGDGMGEAFMEKFVKCRHKFRPYRRAVKKFEDHICTVRESIAGGGSWNQEFKTAVMKYPFVGFCDVLFYGGEKESDSDSESETGRDGFKRYRKYGEDEYEIRDRCAACHRAEFANVSEMYLAGEGYDSNGMWTRSRWDKLLPEGWDSAAGIADSKREVNLCLKLGGTCRFKSHLYHTLLHYKLYLVCKIRHKMDVEGVNPEGLRDERFKDFWDAEKAAVDQLVGRAEMMAKMKNQAEDWRPESWEGIRTIRRWLYVPRDVIEKEEAKREREARLGRPSNSDASGSGSDSSVGIRRGRGSSRGGRGGVAAKGSRSDGGAMSSDSEESDDDLASFIVDD